ncbi:hypothetical protein ATI45_3923 [Marinobacter sp. LV10MA510-1]|nr:hypothetical protein ATI45_3923 [Marinobacter sp. LV10MA510-1]
MHITSAGTATPTTLRLRLHSVGAHAASVSWIDVVPFWWFGASGLGPELVTKPIFFSCAKAVEIGGQLAAQRFKSGDRKLGVLFVGLSGVSKFLAC